jgi:cytochrome P450
VVVGEKVGFAMFAEKRGPKPPTLPGLQIFSRPFGTMPEFFLGVSRERGPIVRFRGPFRSFYFIDDPALIEDLLVHRGADFMKGRGTERLSRLLGRGLLTARQPQHLAHRRMLAPAFHRNQADVWAETMVGAARARADSWPEGATVEIDREMNRLALEIVAKSLFGTDLSSDMDTIARTLDDVVDSFPYALMPFSELFDNVPLPATLKFKAARRRLDAIVYRMLREHRESGLDRGDLLSMLLAARDENDGAAMSDEQIRDEAMTILLAGHETTANAMAWAFYLLGRHPEIRERLFAALDGALGARTPTAADLPRLDYVRAIFSEAMRLYPPAWITARRALVDTKIGAYAIARGDIVIASQYVTQRNPRFFDAPDTFDPDRFIGRSYPKFAYFPFGGGNRLCIGERFASMEGVLVMATIAQRICFEPLDDRAIAPAPLVTLRPSEAIRARVMHRTPAFELNAIGAP